VWGQYTVRVPDDAHTGPSATPSPRERVQAALQAAGVPTAVHYPRPMHLQPAYQRFAPAAGCQVAEQLARQVLSLPMSPDLTEADQDRVLAALKAALPTTQAMAARGPHDTGA